MFNKQFLPFTEPLDIEKGSLRNTYARNKFYTENFAFIDPIEVKLRNELENQDGFSKNDYYHYVPILETIKLLL